MERVTSSRMRAFRRCRRYHHYKYNLCRRPVRRTEATATGSIVHRALEQWWLGIKEGRDDEEILAVAIAACSAAFFGVAEDAEINEYDLVRAEEMVRGYHFRWLSFARGVEVLGVEMEFSGPLINPDTNRPSRTYEMAGKMDVVIRLGLLVYVVEHKTSGQDISPGSIYFEKLLMDPQISTYHNGAILLGYDPAGTLYDVLAKPQLRPKRATPEESRRYTLPKPCAACKAAGKENGFKAKDVPVTPGCEDCEPPRLYAGMRLNDETTEEYRLRVRDAIAGDPDAYYRHAEVVRLAEDIEEHDRDMWIDSVSMRQAEKAGSHPRNPDGCEQYNSLCSYWAVCTRTASIDDPELFVTTAQHVELSETDEP